MLPALLSTSTSGTPAGTSTSRSTGSGPALPPPPPPPQGSPPPLGCSAAHRDSTAHAQRPVPLLVPVDRAQQHPGRAGPAEAPRPLPHRPVGGPVPQHPLGDVGAV